LGREHLCELCDAGRTSAADDRCEPIDQIEREVIADALVHAISRKIRGMRGEVMGEIGHRTKFQC
jgi:hypothetical protein